MAIQKATKTSRLETKARYYLNQAEANEIWAAISDEKSAKKLNKVAADMRKEAIRIYDEISGFDPSKTIHLSDEQLLAELGL